MANMTLPIHPPFPPMEARRVDKIPDGEVWQFEPKWDGFRAIVFRDGDEIAVQSKAGQPLARYFPEVVEAFRTLRSKQFVIDGEIVVPVGGRLSFDHLLQRIHPAQSRARKLAAETPAQYFAFDLLYAKGKLLIDQPIEKRRKQLEALRGKNPFEGRVPGGPSRWATERSGEWEPLRPELVCEVEFDYFSQGRFRHGSKFLRWRPDKKPRQCTMDQVVGRDEGRGMRDELKKLWR